MNDWYDKDYYKHSPVDNPKGPKSGTEKVLRSTIPMGADNLVMADGLAIGRTHEVPEPFTTSDGKKNFHFETYSSRCVTNIQQPIR